MKTLIKYKIIGSFVILLLSVLVHFTYNFLECDLTAIFFPVNESIFEHMKMLFTSYMLFTIIECFFYKKKKLEVNNIIFNGLVTSFICIFTFLLLFLPFYYRFGENMVYIISMEFVAIAVSQFVSYYILSHKDLKLRNVSIFLIIVAYVLFGYFTYNPVINDFFFDPLNEKYGLNTYPL